MKTDVERKIEARVAVAFDDLFFAEHDLQAKQKVLQSAQELVRAVWIGKIYAGLLKDRTTVPRYFLDAELEQFLNEAIEECHEQVGLIAERAKQAF